MRGIVGDLEHPAIGAVALPAMKRACTMMFRVLSIVGSTTEIQKEIIARSLGL
jgi:hypothetical protein